MADNDKTGRAAFPRIRDKLILPQGQRPCNKCTAQIFRQQDEGMTIREYAAIELRVPDSGIPEIDKMIRAAREMDFAAKAMQGIQAKLPMFDRDGEFSESFSQDKILKIQADVASSAYSLAAAMLAEKVRRESE